MLLVPLRTRDLGRVLAALAMAGAIATLLVAGEWSHAIAPATLIAALALSRYLDEKAREARWEGKVF
ncbi:hypothetical protein [Sphingomonas montanisoli]|uniref:Uncharacterized protein n=2 Tax=Sphingomonas TaxID=13687 RepID=A0A5D9CGT6_9SPHN|nr:hypothetical protein [Sphingomonas montanisoli]TZG29295.1 hypothetical protein FYJ91_03975 [Sphingomonas montanisoli]